ncbi:nucleotide-binding oligomerization domain-containing protein 2-like isoform X2 [Montipora foliosa]|uniref:nucleotide-binding oligomerization domain-containing protein 2-like isoform X2 n=1 Tax=Montipora foliosa TaxID=591990 RepID=UPI0035F1607F
MEGGKKGKLCLPVLEDCYGMPPQLKVKPPKLSGLQRVSKPWGSVDLPIDILLLTAEDCEFLSCYSFLGQPVKSYNMEVGTIYFGYIGTDQNQLKVALKTCAKGSVVPGGSSTAVKNAVRVLRPKAVFLVGTCHGLSSDKVKLGDVVVSAKLTTPAGFKIPVSSHLGDLVRDAPFGWVAPLENPDELEVKVHCDGDILSQAEWCKVADLQKQYPEAIAVETEGEGVFAAAYDEKVEWVIVKSVASFVNQTQPSSSEWMSFASTMAASVVAKMISDPAVFKDWPHCNQGASNVEVELANAQKRKRKKGQHEGILTKRLKTDEGSSKDTLKQTHEMSKHLKEKFSEMEGILTKRLKTDEGSSKDTLKERHEMSKHLKDKLSEMEENQERTNIELGEVKEMVKQLQPCERNTKECLKDQQDPVGLVKYISIIRQLYEDREGWLAPFPWCEEFRFNLDNIFTRLKFVSRRKERGIKTDDSVDMFEIFQPHKECLQPRRVLIEGQPGMGKTTYCHKIAFNWTKERKGGESFPDVLLVLLLKCRDINCGLWEAIDDQLLPREVNEEDKERFFTFIRDHQSKVLLVLDGLDELPTSELSIYKEIIQGRVLPESYLVVTARHEVGVKVRDCCHTLLEVEGFTKTDAKNFIQRYFREAEEDLAQELLDKLDSDITLQDLTANPLNVALLCLLCEDFKGQLPESRTLVYLEIVECVLRRYRLRQKLPETDQDLVTLYQVELKQLGRIAMEGLENGSMYFDQSAFQGFSNDLKSGLGFLSVEAGRSKRRPGRSYSFLHKSFQEFFAAHYLCCQLLDGEISVDSLIADLRYFDKFQQVLMFTSGMLAQKCEAAVKELIAGTATQVSLEHCRLKVALACINECKSGENTFDKEMAQFFGSHLQLQHANCLGFNRELAAVCIETMKTNSTVTSLILYGCNIDDASAAALAELLRENSTLTRLQLSDNPIGDVGADALAKGLKENSTLTELYLSNNAIGDVGADALAKGLKENSTLTSLNLSHNAIGDVGADALAKGLKENSTLTRLDLSYNVIGDVGADALAKGLKENSTLTSLGLSNNAIGDVGADALVKGLKENSTLTRLDLSNNAIGDVGADALGLKENTPLHNFVLSDLALERLRRCLDQTSFPALCGPSSLMYRTLIYAVWLTSYPKLSLVPEQIVLHSPMSTALNDGAPGPPSFPRLLCYQLHPPMLPCTCLVSFKRPLLHPRCSQPCTASAGRTILLV